MIEKELYVGHKNTIAATLNKQKIRIVISGSPHSGKTTTLNELKRLGYKVIPESAITVIEYLNNLTSVEDAKFWRQENFTAYQDLITSRQLILEEQYKDESLVIIDSSPIDCQAFCHAYDETPSTFLIGTCYEQKYDMVFILDTILPFNSREETGRLEDEDRALEVSTWMRDIYSDYSFDPILVTQQPIVNRTRFITDRITAYIEATKDK